MCHVYSCCDYCKLLKDNLIVFKTIIKFSEDLLILQGTRELLTYVHCLIIILLINIKENSFPLY